MSARRTGAPGAWREPVTRTGRFEALAPRLPANVCVIADERVLRLHPKVRRALAGHQVIALRAGERAKSLATVQRLATETPALTRGGTVVAVGGGTIGDVATVFAHLARRGVRLIQVPTTLLAAVDSSVGGKGAVNVGSTKNALGVFHYPVETWLCLELFATLSEQQRREGRVEAWKIALLDGATWRRWLRAAPEDGALLLAARALKERVCAEDPYETTGLRTGLNLGHTFGHVIESLTHFRIRHGEAVGLGLLCALDVGVALGVTPRSVARAIEQAFPQGPHPRRRLAGALRVATPQRVARHVLLDKKRGADGALRMVLLARPGTWSAAPVGARVWRGLLAAWRRGRAP